MNGTQVLTNFDIFATAGGEYIAVVEQFTATASTTSTDVFQCSGALASGSGPEQGLEAALCAAFNRGVAMNIANWNNPVTYYMSSIKNDYAMVWHTISINHKAYGFAYDDVNGQSSVEILPNANPPTVLTLSVGW
jgi:Beta-1,3-glucanase